MSEWQKVRVGLPCGCFMEGDVFLPEGITPEQAVEHYASQISFGVHTSDHRALCKPLPVGHEPFYLDDFPPFRGIEGVGVEA